MRAAIIAGLMAAGLLAGCGGMSDGQENLSCANGSEPCGLSDATVESAEPGTRTDSLYHTFICCDGTECTSTAGFCVKYCSENERGGICS
jgi:hypothetical protein